MAKSPRKSTDGIADNPAVPTKRMLNLSITDEAYKRLSHHAIAEGTTASALVNAYAMTLPEYGPKTSA